MKHFYVAWTTLCLSVFGLASRAQTTTGGVRIGTVGTPNTSAVLDLSPDVANAPKGLLPPRLTLAQRSAIGSPATGLVVYQTDNVPGLYLYNGSIWVLQADNLGNHTATQNLNLGPYQLVGNGGSQGLGISSNGSLATVSSITAGNAITASRDVVVDAAGANAGTQTNSLRLGGSTSGEGLASKRSTGGNQYGLDFYTSALSRLSISGSGLVGIGTAAPGQLLELGGQAAPAVLLHSNGNGLLAGATLQFRESNAAYGWNLRHNSGGSEGGTTDDRLVLESANGGAATPVMTWNQSSGNVGIGTTTPGQQFELGGQAAPTLLLHSAATNVLSGATLQFRENDLSYGWNLRHNSGQAEGTFPPFGTANTHDRLLLEGLQGAAPTTLMAWDQTSHRVGINTDSPTSELQVDGSIFATVEVVASSFRTSSDARLKQRVRPLAGALAGVQRLRGVRYTWNAQGVAHGGQAGAEQLGLLAQELEQVYPELVSTGPHGYKTVNYAQLTPVLLEAIKELKAQLDAATQRAARAEARQQQVQAAQLADHADLQTLREHLARLEAAASGSAQACSH